MTIVETSAGRVRGAVGEGVTVFRGVPYAAPPVGVRRFRAPQQVEPWTGVRDTLEFGPFAMQSALVLPTGDILMEPQGEGCLTLNVWTPGAGSGRHPVLVYIHGGAYHHGGTRYPSQDLSPLARDGDVVVVSVTHRLGALGYLYFGGLDPDFADTANVALLDLVAALEWVRDNIEAFGGDPGRVTVFGESGGGWKISNLLAMPVATGLFHGAIIQSGSYPHALSLEEADDRTGRLLAELRISRDRLDLLAEVPVERLVATEFRHDGLWGKITDDGSWQWDFEAAPVVDGTVLPREPFAPDSPEISAHIPLLVGVTRDEFAGAVGEMTFPRESDPVGKAVLAGLDRRRAERAIDFYRGDRGHLPGRSPFAEFLSDRLFLHPAVLQAERRIARGGAPVYEYIYSFGWPHEHGRAPHAGDIAFVFGNLANAAYPDPTPEAEKLSRMMRLTWAAFAHGGDPNNSGISRWEPYDLDRRSTFIFDVESRLESDPRRERRLLVESEARH
jgi:para-nitrobenzyl esterase